ncbi:MAG: hypothetical protein ABW148_02865, partial [Sedimenticola sp.]
MQYQKMGIKRWVSRLFHQKMGVPFISFIYTLMQYQKMGVLFIPGQRGDPMSERSRSANLRADEQKSHIRPNPW